MAIRSHCLAEHKEIRTLIRGLKDHLDLGALRGNPQPSIHLLLRLGGLLKQHFSMEKDGLYGRLVASSNPLVRATALVAQDDLCGLEPKVMAFIRQWTAAGRIQDDTEGYVREADALFRAIGRRLGQEERDLLPMLAAVS